MCICCPAWPGPQEGVHGGLRSLSRAEYAAWSDAPSDTAAAVAGDHEDSVGALPSHTAQPSESAGHAKGHGATPPLAALGRQGLGRRMQTSKRLSIFFAGPDEAAAHLSCRFAAGRIESPPAAAMARARALPPTLPSQGRARSMSPGQLARSGAGGAGSEVGGGGVWLPDIAGRGAQALRVQVGKGGRDGPGAGREESGHASGWAAAPSPAGEGVLPDARPDSDGEALSRGRLAV